MSRPFAVARFPCMGIDPHPRRKAQTGRLGSAVGLFPLRGYPSLSAPESGTATAPLCGQLAGVSLRFFVFFAPGGYRCRGIPGMAKPPSTPKGARQRTDTGFSRLSWTHPIRAETGFLPFRGGGGWRWPQRQHTPGRATAARAFPYFLRSVQKIGNHFKGL